MIWKAGIWKKYYVFHLSDFTIQYWENYCELLALTRWPHIFLYFSLTECQKSCSHPMTPHFLSLCSHRMPQPVEGGPYTRIHFIFDCPPAPDLQAYTKIVHFICWEWLRPACYRLFEVVLGHLIQAGPMIRTIRVFAVFPLGMISYTNIQTNNMCHVCAKGILRLN